MTKSYEQLVAEFKKLPNCFNALAPIVVPVILMAASSIVTMAKMKGFGIDIVKFLGTPVIALGVGTAFAVLQLKLADKIKDFMRSWKKHLK